ncbi:flippase [Ruminococcus sp. 5_1_39BFAA]|uniref:flippase n=1 Tax=Ruminococcus sp. 5_1_39BFAA TaxID=457412 RepID=UPI0035640C0C
MFQTKSLKVNSAINIIKTILSIIFPLITFPYASRVLGVNGIGKVDYANSVANYFVLFAELGITTYTIREGAKIRDNKEKLNQLCSEIVIISSISTVIAYMGLVLCSFLPVFNGYQELLLLFGTTMLFNLIGINWIFNIFEDYIYITVRTFAFQLLALIALFVFVRTKTDYMIYAGLVVLSNVGSNVFNIFYGKRYIKLFGRKHYELKKHMKPILIIFGMSVASQIYLNMDTTMIGAIKGDAEVGLYSAAVKINRTLGTLISSACAVLIPRLSYYIKQGMKEEYREVIYNAVNYIMGMAIPCAFGFVLLSPELITIFSGVEFGGSVPIMRILSPNIILSVINGFLVFQVFVPFDRETDTLSSTVVGAVVNMILNFILIFSYGAKGAAVATVIAEGTVYVILSIKMKEFYRDESLYGELWKYFTAGLGMFAVGLLIGALKLGIILNIIVTVLLCVAVYFMILIVLKAKLVCSIREIIKR